MAKSNNIDKLSGYDLARRWFDFAFEKRECKSQHTAIYMWIIELNNRLGWKSEFGLPTSDTMEGLSIGNKNTYLDALRDIAAWGFITIIKESKNQYQACIIQLCRSKSEPARSTALDMALIHHGYSIDNSNGVGIGFSTVPIDKPVNNETIKPINNIPEAVASATLEIVLNFSFKEFWDLYDKKVGSWDKIKKKWEKLKPDDRQEIMDYLPKYKTAQPDKKYRKNPDTFLNNKSWKDEIINANGITITNTATSIEQRKADRDGMGDLARGVLAKIAAEHCS